MTEETKKAIIQLLDERDQKKLQETVELLKGKVEELKKMRNIVFSAAGISIIFAITAFIIKLM